LKTLDDIVFISRFSVKKKSEGWSARWRLGWSEATPQEKPGHRCAGPQPPAHPSIGRIQQRAVLQLRGKAALALDA
jgi:hypothetical protein